MKIFYYSKKTLDYIPISHFLKATILLILVSVYCITISYSYNNGVKDGEKKKFTEEDIIVMINENENNSFTPKKFYDFLKQINIKFPEIVFAQSFNECGFKSPIFKNNNNLFGMKEASVRPKMQNGTDNGHAYYNNWKESVIDYALYQSYMLKDVKTENQYLKYLKEYHYYDTNDSNTVNYLSNIKFVAHHIENYLKD